MTWNLRADLTGAADGQTIIFDAARQLYVPADLAGGVDVSDDGTPVVSPATLLNFGTGLSVTDDGGGQATVDATGSGGSVDVDDNGTPVAAASTLNFGTNLSVTDDGGGQVTIDGTGGGGGAVTLIDSQQLASSAADIEFTSIPATYSHLMLCGVGRTTGSGPNFAVRCRLNGDTGASAYAVVGNTAQTSLANPQRAPSVTSGSFTEVGLVAGATAGANTAGQFNLHINHYTGTDFHKFLTSQISHWDGSIMFVRATGGVWKSTAAVTSILLYPSTGDWVAGSRVDLYGIS